MPTFEDAIVVRTTPLRAYELTQSYDTRLSWDPFLKEARLLNGATVAAKGVRAWCVSSSGLGMETEYVHVEPGRVAAVVMTRGPWPLAKFAGSWLFKPEPPDSTRVVFRYHIRGRFGPLRFLTEPLIVFWFRREMRPRLEALKAALERA